VGNSGLKDKLDIDAIVSQVVARLAPHMEGGTSARAAAPAPAPKPATVSVPAITAGDGVFTTTDEAVKAAAAAQAELSTRSMDDREKIVSAIKRLCEEKAGELARLEFEETKIGRLDHKVDKLKLVRRVLGTEALKTESRGDSTGVDLVGAAPWGVIGMVTPATHSVPTMAGNAINVIAAGNSAVFSPHPAASRCFAFALKLFNREIQRETGIRNLLCMVQDPTIASAEELFNHKGVSLICVTGGPFVVKAAMKSGKRVIAAGPGNPPVVVDATADMDKAAKDIIAGASFDNNLLCIGEKEVFVVKEAYEAFRSAMKKAGAVELNAAEIAKLTGAALTVDPKHSNHIFAKREFVGADTKVLAAAAGKTIPAGTDLLFGETDEKHPFVVAEQMMPFIPVVRANNADEAIEMAVRAEHGFRHTAIIHSNDLKVVTKMARRMNTTLFIQNATCAAALGLGGPGYLSYSIATPTGEGVTTPLTFTRQRQLIMGETLNYL
jgi:aldehyde dehydrogenase